MSGIIPTDDLEALVGEALQRSGHEEHIASTLNRISGINHIGSPASSSLGKRRFALLLDKSKTRSTAENSIGTFSKSFPWLWIIIYWNYY